MTRPTGLEVVASLCELVLAARRLGCTVRVVDAPDQVKELIVLAGLERVLLEDHGGCGCGPAATDDGGDR